DGVGHAHRSRAGHAAAADRRLCALVLAARRVRRRRAPRDPDVGPPRGARRGAGRRADRGMSYSARSAAASDALRGAPATTLPTQSATVDATSSQPSPTTRRWDRPGNSTKSVTAPDFPYFSKFARAVFGGTVWSCSPAV